MEKNRPLGRGKYTPNPSYNQNFKNSSQKDTKVTCQICNKIGHTANACFKYVKSSGKNATATPAKADNDDDLFCAAVTTDIPSTAMLTVNNGTVICIDSGASMHMCNERTAFNT